MKREEKKEKAESFHEALKKARTVILSGFEGLNVQADTELRRKVAETGARYEVVKNRLVERAAQGTSTEPVAQGLRGTTSVAYTESEPVALAKVLTSYAKENPALVFKAGMVEGRVVSLAELMEIASLPSREDLLARALFLMKEPGREIAVAVSDVARRVARVIQQGVEKNKFKAAAGQ